MTARDARGAVFVMPRRSTEWADAAAMWITVAGWAHAAEQRFGHAWVVTPDAVADAATVITYPDRPRPDPTPRRRGLSVFTPDVVVTAAKDVRRWRQARRYAVTDRDDWADCTLEFVWQHHDVFHTAGEQLARSHRIPLVSYVHAPQVWEARRWGVHRPGWSHLLERRGEVPQLERSDVVACVSQEVADEVERLGIDPTRIVVSPMAVDAERFGPTVDGAAARRRLGIGTSTFVLGWTGSFRQFHGLEVGLDAFARFHADRPDSLLLLVGDGARRADLERRAHELGLADAVVFPGAASHHELPGLVAAMDAAFVTARAGEQFHYSPLKLREYLACGVAVAAPRIGDVDRTLTDHVDALLYEPGDCAALAHCFTELATDPTLRRSLGGAGRELIMRTGTWSVQLEHLLTSAPFLAARERLTRPAGAS